MNKNSYEKLKCIWMASQVIEYKLCDNNFDCENCLFDKAMKNFMNRAEDKYSVSLGVVGDITRKLTEIEYDDKILYLENNLIAKNICNDTFYFGLNPILECFLDSGSSVNVNVKSQIINKEEKIIDILGNWGSVCISSPADFIIYDRFPIEKNDLLKPKWQAIIGDVNGQISNRKSSRREWENSYKKAICMLEDIRHNEPAIGETMKDGGMMIKFLHQLIGNKKYVELLRLLSS